MELFLTIVHIVAALFMIMVILVQGGNSGGVGAAFGGGNSQGVFGASGATTFLAKITYFVAGIFMLTSIGLSWAQKQSGSTGLIDRLEQQSQEESSLPSETTDAASESATETPAQPSTESTDTEEAAPTE